MTPDHPITLQTTLIVTDDQVSADLDQESAILNIATGTYYGLDAIGTRVWQMFRTPRTIATVCDALANEYDVDRGNLETDIQALAIDLVEAGLLKPSDS